MSLVVPNDAEVIMLNYVLNINAPENLSIRLYANNVSPTESSTIDTFIELQDGLGYRTGGQSLMPSAWEIIAGNPSQAEHMEMHWTFTGAAGYVYGYYVTQDTGGELLWAERFEKGPFEVKISGDEICITPRLALNSNRDSRFALRNNIDYVQE